MGIRKVTPANVERLYAEGRHRYSKWETDAKNNSPEPQAQSDKRAPGYDNSVDPKGKEGWLIGHGKPHPSFDSDPAGEPTRKK
jgi:hypothetical protein